MWVPGKRERQWQQVATAGFHSRRASSWTRAPLSGLLPRTGWPPPCSPPGSGDWGPAPSTAPTSPWSGGHWLLLTPTSFLLPFPPLAICKVGGGYWRTSPPDTYSVQFSSVAQSCPTLCDPINCSMSGLPAHHQVSESTQTHVRWVG